MKKLSETGVRMVIGGLLLLLTVVSIGVPKLLESFQIISINKTSILPRVIKIQPFILQDRDLDSKTIILKGPGGGIDYIVPMLEVGTNNIVIMNCVFEANKPFSKEINVMHEEKK